MASSPNQLHSFDVGIRHVRRVGLPVALLTGNGFSVQANLPFRAENISAHALNYPLGRRGRELLLNLPGLSGEDALRYLTNFPIPHPDDQSRTSEYTLLQSALRQAIIDAHPDQRSAIDSAALGRAAAFFALHDSVFTTNYDLLAYWALLSPQLRNAFSDSFRRVEQHPDTGELALIFDPLAWPLHRKLYYLHGALHLMQHTTATQKLEWSSSAGNLVTQFQRQAELGNYPLLVIDGDSERKADHIRAAPYLTSAHASLAQWAGAMFTYGFSFSWQDLHVVDALLTNHQLQQLWIGLYGDVGSPDNVELVFRVTFRQAELGLAGRGPAILYYQAETAPF